MNDKTPPAWKAAYRDYSAVPTGETLKEETLVAETTERMDVLTAPPIKPINGEADEKAAKPKKRKKKDAEAEEDEPEPTESGEKKKKKKKKVKSEE